MISSEKIHDAVSKIDPYIIMTYLKKMRWEIYPLDRKDIRIFQYRRGEMFEQVTIPLNRSLRDYDYAMYDTVCKIAHIENRSVKQQIMYFVYPNADILKIRLDKENIKTGNIPLDEAINLYENAKKLLSAAAQDIVHPKTIHVGRTDSLTQDFLSQCRFGQTEIGSYVISIVCPLVKPYTPGQLNLFPEDDEYAYSLGRMTTNRIITNINTIKQKIDSGNVESLTNCEENISLNFYEALNGLNSKEEKTSIEFDVNWSSGIHINRCQCDSVLITDQYYDPIEKIINEIKKSSYKTTTITGKITQLKAAPTVNERQYGCIVVAYIDDNKKSKSVTAVLTKKDYENAIKAHQHGKRVKLTGDLQKTPKAVMKNTIFSVL